VLVLLIAVALLVRSETGKIVGTRAVHRTPT
jgi:hypothetical protein